MKQITLIKSRLCHLGGAEKYARHLIDAFAQKGCRVSVLTTGKVESLDNVSFYTIDEKGLTSIQAVNRFERFCQRKLLELTSDRILGLDRTSFQTHLRASNGVHAAYLKHRTQVEPWLKTLSFRFNPLHKTLLDLEKKAFCHPKLQTLIVNSHLVKQEILENYPVDTRKIVVVPNGVEWKERETIFTTSLNEKSKIAVALNLDPNLFHFVFIGHGFKRKGLIPLLEGLSLLKNSDFHLSVVGQDKHVPYFESRVKKLGLHGKVRFFGEQKNPLPFYLLADCITVPSYYDPFANVTVEALAMGNFVLSSKTNGGCEVLNSATGIMIDSLHSPDSVKEALTIAMQHPKTKQRAHHIRESIKHLDFSNQLTTITDLCLK